MTHPRFFGYGSLVNLATHDYPEAEPATLTGWRRVWKFQRDAPLAFLAVEPHDTTLHGITAAVPGADWDALDAREYCYLRRDVSDQFNTQTAVYEANPDFTHQTGADHVILLSYLDVVIGGYHQLMGDAGPAHFFATTSNWMAVLDDRDAPQYPRAQPLSEHIRDTVDAALEQLRVTPIKRR